MSDFNCPNCGNGISPAIKAIKMLSCPSCGTTLFLEDQGAKVAGEAGVMHDMPLLFGLGDTVQIASWQFAVLGHARFSYGRGTWDEFFCRREDGALRWISVDEGDVVIQQEVSRRDWPRYDRTLKLGRQIRYDGEDFTVIEMDEATCVALRGSFDHPLSVGERYDFVNLQDEHGRLLSGEFQGDYRDWYTGVWVDPFDIRVETAGRAAQ